MITKLTIKMDLNQKYRYLLFSCIDAGLFYKTPEERAYWLKIDKLRLNDGLSLEQVIKDRKTFIISNPNHYQILGLDNKNSMI